MQFYAQCTVFRRNTRNLTRNLQGISRLNRWNNHHLIMSILVLTIARTQRKLKALNQVLYRTLQSMICMLIPQEAQFFRNVQLKRWSRDIVWQLRSWNCMKYINVSRPNNCDLRIICFSYICADCHLNQRQPDLEMHSSLDSCDLSTPRTRHRCREQVVAAMRLSTVLRSEHWLQGRV